MPLKLTIAFVLSVGCFVPSASAIVVGGSNPNDYLSSQTAVGYSLVGGAGGCSGSLLSTGMHFLTAAHCILGATGNATITFLNSSNTQFQYTSVSMIGHPDFDPGNYSAGNDLAVITLDQVVDSSINRLSLYTGNGELNQIGTLIGRGGTGIGSNSDRTSDGIRREGTNTIDQILNNRVLFFDFDDGSTSRNTLGSATPTSREVSIYFGDSGGPVLLNGQIAGIHSYLTCVGAASSATATACNTTIDVDGVINGSFGERFGATRVSYYNAWIQAVIGTPASPQLDGASVPEPSTCIAGLSAVLICLARFRRTASSHSGKRP